ncbi:heme-binding protein, partial [Leucobacter sp. M11]|uniref:heme-binding protein n=1 Tax=Leucobacter sp. M11 TaxID=2993565 RepID=UPI003FA5CF2F
ALDEGAKRNLALVAAVVDPATGLVAFGRADGAPPHSELTSRRKAITAASMRQV